MTNTLKIYGERLSRAERVLWMADECGLEYDHISVPVNGEKPDSLLSINADGAIPTIDDDGFIVSQSWAITLYLARKYAPDMASRNAQEEADILRWSFWGATDVETTVIQTIYATGALPGIDRDVELLNANHEKLKRPIRSLNHALASRDYVAGDRFTVGDLNAGSITSWLKLTGFDFTDFQNVDQWLGRILTRPKFPNRSF